MSALVSIIIPCYNQGQFLAEAIQRAIDQDYEQKEIIVVNDGSTDNTKEVTESFIHSITYIEQENKGVSSARNVAIEIANGEYVAFLDSDDVLLPGSITKKIAHLESHPDISLVCSDSIFFNESGSLGLRSQLLNRPKNIDNFRWETVDYNATLSSVMLRRSCLEKAGLFEESIQNAEDWLMWVRMSRYFNMAFIDEPLIKYRLHSGNFTRSIEFNNVGHRNAIMQTINASYFYDYPAYFRAQLLFLRFASVYRFAPMQEAFHYFMLATKTDPAQIGFGVKVIYRGLKNTVRRYKRE